MARDYWVEGLSTGRPRFVKIPITPSLHRSHTHDGSNSQRGSTRSARVDFADVTRKEASALRRANEDLERENALLKANFRATDYELRKCRTTLDYERESGGHHHRHHHREREDALRKLRHQNSKLRSDNEALLLRVGRLEAGAVGGSATRRLVEEVRKWKAQCASMDDEAERLYHKIEAVVRRNKRLETAAESAARQTRELQRDVEYYKAILRRHGFATR